MHILCYLSISGDTQPYQRQVVEHQIRPVRLDPLDAGQTVRPPVIQVPAPAILQVPQPYVIIPPIQAPTIHELNTLVSALHINIYIPYISINICICIHNIYLR